MANRHFICPTCGVVCRASAPNFKLGTRSPKWPCHCNAPMRLLGYRQSQVATQLTLANRLKWLAKGARVIKHGGKKKWKAAIADWQLRDAYPLL
jgi:hypothetical protein